MKALVVVSRLLLGLLFAVFGLNGFLHFIPIPEPQGMAGQFMDALRESHYLAPIYAIQLMSGVLVLVNRYVPLALAILAPVVVNIAMYHLLMAPEGLAGAALAATLWAIVFHRERAAFSGVFAKLRVG